VIKQFCTLEGKTPSCDQIAVRTLQLSFGFDRSIDVDVQLPTTIRSNGAVPYTYARLYEPIT
jgi:hypothetical protein